MISDNIIQLVGLIEGPYKWYILAGVIVVLTAFLTKFVFKTLKWFVLIAALAFIVYYVITAYGSKVNDLLPEETKSIPSEVESKTLDYIQTKILGY